MTLKKRTNIKTLSRKGEKKWNDFEPDETLPQREADITS